ncbi:MAG TPA: serine hydrolase [bacterium]|nr:serine hydrolase [bacterium]
MNDGDDPAPAGGYGSLTPIRRLLEDGVGRAYPGAVLEVSRGGDVVIRWAVGARSLVPEPEPAAPETIYDLASLTKVVVTTPLILQAAAEGRLRLDDSIATYLPESTASAITLRHLLTHSSGLPAWIPFYLETSGYDAVIARAAARAAEAAPGPQAVYSDVGFILLGEVARRALGGPLDALARERLFTPLAMHHTTYRPLHARLGRIAPTEDGTAIEQAMAGGEGRRHTWRHSLIWGEVHDSNAHAMGGVSGHAGLFGTADDLTAYARMWLAGGRGPHGSVLPEDLVREATMSQVPAGTRGLGWALTGTDGWWGAALSPRAYGHTGFTGTAIVIDPAHDLAIVLLTNAIHLGRDRTEILTLRPQIAGAVAAALL